MKEKRKWNLKSNKDFSNVYSKGKSKANRQLVMYCIKNDYDQNRVGYSISKKVGNSIVRNKIKRRLKEIYRLNKSSIKQGYDLVFIVRTGAKKADYKQLEDAFNHLIKISKMKNK